jgi:hypothetical protein
VGLEIKTIFLKKIQIPLTIRVLMSNAYCFLYSKKTIVLDLYILLILINIRIKFRRTVNSSEVEFLEEIQTEVLRVFLLAIHRHLY